MSDQKLTEDQKNAISGIKIKWLKEADEYLNKPASGVTALDGEDTAALNGIQEKYKMQIQKILNPV